jgi:hypothetical protein
MTTIHVKRDGQRDLKFEGELIAEVSSHVSRGERQNRWTEMALYKSQSGKFVVAIKGITIWQGEHDRYRGHVCGSTTQLVGTLIEDNGEGKLSWLAKELLDKAGIDSAEEV